VRAFQNALFGSLARTIQRYDGFVEKFVGDAVMAVFGAPVAHEDDPQRALGAALDILEGSATLGREWAARLGSAVTLHVGVHTGPVVAGSLGGPAGGAYAVTGDTVNTTARLCSVAQPGQIILSEATFRKVQGTVAAVPLAPVRVKGKADELRVYNAVGLRSKDWQGDNTRPS